MSYDLIFGIRPKPIYREGPPVRDEAYLRFIASFPCVVCGKRAEAAHTGPHGMRQKSSDLSAIPLCRKHHRTGPDSYHASARTFADRHCLDIPSLIAQFNALWAERQARRAA